MYADNLLLILQRMLTVCTNYGHSFDIVLMQRSVCSCVLKNITRVQEFRCLLIMLLLQNSL